MGAERGPFGELEPGVVFDGRFVVERVVGVGGMGCVIAAQHLNLDRRVAIKIMLATPGEDAQGRRAQRLVHEARAAAKLKSDHGLRIFDVVSSGAYAPYIVMEYLEGESLSQRLRRGQLSPAEAVDFTVQACEAVGEAHHHGIVHRDLKPSNLFLVDRPRGRLKVLDFGIARSVASFDAQLTDSHALLGSPGYVAPEQLESPNSVNHRADVWSLGVVLFECLTGRRPFEGKNLVELYNRILNDPPRSLRGVEPKLPRALDIVVARCLKKDPAERFESAEALVLALREFAPEAAARCVAYLRALSVPSLEPREAELADVPTGSTLTAAAREVKRPVVPPGRARKRIRRSWALLPLAVLGAGVWLWRNLDRELGAPAAASSTAVSHVVPTVTSALPPRVASSNDPALRLPDSNPSEAPNLSVRRLPASKPAASRDTRAVQTRSHAPLASGKPVRSAAASTNASPVQSVEHPAWAETR